jgi:hypothetical protein
MMNAIMATEHATVTMSRSARHENSLSPKDLYGNVHNCFLARRVMNGVATVTLETLLSLCPEW